MEDTKFQNILEYPWFTPGKLVNKEALHTLVQEHQKRLKPFGCAQSYPCKTCNIWPGESAENIILKKREAKNSLLQMFIDNSLQILRIMNLEAGKLQKIDHDLREKEIALRDIIKKAAIESAGITIRSTITIPKLNYRNRLPSEEDIVDLAVEEAVKITLWHLCWSITEEEIALLKKYLNPFEPLMKIFALGLWPLGISQKQYWIFLPKDSQIEE